MTLGKKKPWYLHNIISSKPIKFDLGQNNLDLEQNNQPGTKGLKNIPFDIFVNI